MIGRQRRTHLNQTPPLAPQPPLQLQRHPAARRRKNPPNPWVMPWILQKQDRGCYSNLVADLIHIDIPGYQNFVSLPPAFFNLIKECIHHRIKKSFTNFGKPLEVGLKLVIMLRHLVTGATYTSLQYHWLVGRTTICKFVHQVCRAILAEFQDKYFSCNDSPDE